MSLFISFEGLDGSGKSSQIKKLTKRLEEHGVEYVVTREPGGTEFGEKIRTLLLDKSTDICTTADMLLFAAARAQHVHEVIEPNLKAGRIVICDRFVHSSLAYQGLSGDTRIANEIAMHGIVPRRVYLMDIEVQHAMSRLQSRSELDRFDSQSKEYFNKVRNRYLQMAESESDQFVILDATKPISTNSQIIWNDIERLIDIYKIGGLYANSIGIN